MNNHVKHLNQHQHKAAVSDANQLIVLAGPGTGKTKTLVARLLYLLDEKKIDPSDIATFTFTRAAATEIKERVQKEIGTHSLPFIGTFHALAYDILVQRNKKLTLISQTDQKDLISRLLKRYPATIHPNTPLRELIHMISLYKNSQKNLSGEPGELVKDYNKELKQRGFVDYDDLLLLLLAHIKKYLRPQFTYILVDEFQDVNDLQYRLIKKLLRPKGYLFLIGDIYQSIYGFRGSSPKLVSRLTRDFPKIVHMDLIQTYRSAPEIVNVISSLLPDRILTPVRSEKGEVRLIQTYNEFSEAEFIISEIMQRVGGLDLLQGTNTTRDIAGFSDFAILFRTRELARVIETALLNSGIPYQLIGAESPFQTKGFAHIFQTLKNLKHTYNEKIRVSQIVEDCIKKSKLSISTATKKTTSTLSILVSLAVTFDSSEQGLEKFLSYLQYLEEHEFYDSSADVVTLSTIHSSKGREFRYVYVLGFEEGLLPYTRKISTQEELDEELRLLYVGVSRAKDGIYLFHTKARNRKAQQLSSFARFFGNLVEKRRDPLFEKLRKKKERELRRGIQSKLF